MKYWKACVAKNANHLFEYYSVSQEKWIKLEEMNEAQLMNVVKKLSGKILSIHLELRF